MTSKEDFNAWAARVAREREEAKTSGATDGPTRPKRGGGPKTPEGKKRSARNSWKHGLTSSNPVGGGESEEEWLTYRANKFEALQPADSAEEDEVEIIASAEYRMRRGARYEAAFIDKCYRLHALPERKISTEEKFLAAWGCDIQLGVEVLGELQYRDGSEVLEPQEAHNAFWLVCVFSRERGSFEPEEAPKPDAQWTYSDLGRWLSSAAAKFGLRTEDLIASVTTKARKVLEQRRLHRTASEGAGAERLFEPRSPLLNAQRYEVGLQRMAEKAYKRLEWLQKTRHERGLEAS